ncbi:hypothetical protein OAU50_01920 [Planctomycetota bacterium]|nr:hypothetical protein [Planctomycetota bacterium]
MNGAVNFKERGVQVAIGGFVICVGAPIARVMGSDIVGAILLGVGMLTVVIGIAVMMVSRHKS